ncbi:hypothetical protein H6F50_18810 [Coleofasciculus sp. FACHB-712]|uniref:hypothetical protein n=1 Tax=Cyanophyceae TaxID=3028117 RepID=UPI0016848C6B|nr:MULTISPECIES: hypothetical protein [unclassified Coleofasciculus]MBD1895538.1 hypothetical protein [Coleofasciculus sp. FACHB-129]MBD1944380.1 hypothetical protein [Coleofasciculus sp. FACHB-712]
MTKKNMKLALNASLKAEDEAVKSRFEKAESLLGDGVETNRKSEVTPQVEAQSREEQVKKERVIRDSFTLPCEDYELISAIRQRCLNSAVNVAKSEVIRAGLHALNDLPDEALLKVIESLTKIKTGRPAKRV